jgi:hypothetical protein
MFKPSERRFEYNVNPQGADDDRFGKYVPNTRMQEYGSSAATPINKRPSLNYSMLDDRERSNLHDTSYQPAPRNE